MVNGARECGGVRKKKMNKDSTLFKSPKVDPFLQLTLFLRGHPPGPGPEHSAWNRQSRGGDADDLRSDPSGGQSQCPAGSAS